LSAPLPPAHPVPRRAATSYSLWPQ